MRKFSLILCLLFTLLMVGSSASATLVAESVNHYFAVDESSPTEDVVLLTNVIQYFKEELGDNHESKLNQEISKGDLDNRVTLFIYKQDALLIVGDQSPTEHVVLANKISNYLTANNIMVIQKLDSEILSDDLRDALPLKVDCSGIVVIADCVNTERCTVLDDGSGCITDNPLMIEVDYCNLADIADCIDNKGCTLDEIGHECVVATPDEMVENLPIHDFKIESGYYSFWMPYIFSDFYIDGEKVNVEYGPMSGSGGYTWYKIMCKEGELLHSQKIMNTITGEIGATALDISDYDCEECDDSDGMDYFTSGLVEGFQEGQEYSFSDSCLDDRTVLEYHCKNNRYQREEYTCAAGCDAQRGTCREIEDFDVNEDQPESSDTCPTETCQITSEQCIGTDNLIQQKCSYYIYEDQECKEYTSSVSEIVRNVCSLQKKDCFGCLLSLDSCIPIGVRFQDNEDKSYCDITKVIELQKDNTDECQNGYECESNNCKGGFCRPVCEGCLDDKKICLPIGTRTGTQYCGRDMSFKEQGTEDTDCDNNYECSTNLCVTNKCISPNLIQKIIAWFKRLFG